MKLWKKPVRDWNREDYWALGWWVVLMSAAAIIGRLIAEHAAR